jgi:hypothetical protein
MIGSFPKLGQSGNYDVNFIAITVTRYEFVESYPQITLVAARMSLRGDQLRFFEATRNRSRFETR